MQVPAVELLEAPFELLLFLQQSLGNTYSLFAIALFLAELLRQSRDPLLDAFAVRL
jgi:hypothetical protein